MNSHIDSKKCKISPSDDITENFMNRFDEILVRIKEFETKMQRKSSHLQYKDGD